MLVSFWYVLYTTIIHKTRPLPVEKGLRMTFLTINAHNKMLDVTCHRNLETTYLNDLHKGGGGGQILEDYC
jgi:hypothetical protein